MPSTTIQEPTKQAPMEAVNSVQDGVVASQPVRLSLLDLPPDPFCGYAQC